MSDQEILVGGTWRRAPAAFAVRDPYTGDVVGHAADATPHDMVAAVESAAAHRWRLRPHERRAILEAAADGLVADREAFATSVRRESGMAHREALREVEQAVGLLRTTAAEISGLRGESMVTDVLPGGPARHAMTVLEPVGLVLAITPFNRPLNQVVVKLAPAVATNNGVVLKPSEKAPLTALRFVRLLIESGLPPEMVSVVTGRPAPLVTAALDTGLIDMITFTGSSAVGRSVAAAAPLCRIAMELGDVGALVVLADADLDAAARSAAKGAFGSAGQSCRGVKRILVAGAVSGEFTERLVEHARAIRVGDPADPATEMGTLIDEAAATTVESRVSAAVDAGARLRFGGQRKAAQYWPTVLDRVPPDTAVVAEETFGPVAPVIDVADARDAVSMINTGRFGLQTGVFSRDVEVLRWAAHELRVGTVIFNEGPQFSSPAVPFGGVKHSGLGREGARWAMTEMCVTKTIVL